VKVRHAGETTFTTSGLTNNPNATCSNGIPSSGTNIANVDTESHTVSIYTCAASTYAAVTPDGPQNPTPVVSTPSTPTGNSSGGGSFSSYSAPVSTVSTQPIQAINTGTVASTSSVTWTQVFPKKPTKKLETYTLKLTEANKKKPEYVVLPVGFKNGTKIKIRLIAKNGKTFTTTTTVKNGKITFRPRVSGTYEVIKK
jgi:hypothetical protein